MPPEDHPVFNRPESEEGKRLSVVGKHAKAVPDSGSGLTLSPATLIRFLRKTHAVENSLRDDCWMWTGATRSGYGAFWAGGRVHRAHRVSYEWFRGPVPEGLELDHLCETKACVNPRHLEPVPHVLNLNRSERYRTRHLRRAR